MFEETGNEKIVSCKRRERKGMGEWDGWKTEEENFPSWEKHENTIFIQMEKRKARMLSKGKQKKKGRRKIGRNFNIILIGEI